MIDEWTWEIRSEGGPIIVFHGHKVGRKQTICTVHPLRAKLVNTICAAPELLAAAEALDEALNCVDELTPEQSAARDRLVAAIAKAKS